MKIKNNITLLIILVLTCHIALFGQNKMALDWDYSKYCTLEDEYAYEISDSSGRVSKIFVAVLKITAPTDKNLLINFSRLYDNFRGTSWMFEDLVDIVSPRTNSVYPLDYLLTTIQRGNYKSIILQSDKYIDIGQTLHNLRFFTFNNTRIIDAYPLVKEWNIASNIILLPYIR